MRRKKANHREHKEHGEKQKRDFIITKQRVYWRHFVAAAHMIFIAANVTS